jgi:hypothetical protein
MFDSNIFNNLKYFALYQIAFAGTFIILSSLGAFFHFLLDHEISIVESWLHNNHWEILITAKLSSLFLLNRWFKLKLYQLKSLRVMIKDLVSWPDPKAVVISLFMAISYLSLSGIQTASHNIGYWYYHFASFLGLSFYFGIDFVVLAYLDDILQPTDTPTSLGLAFGYTGLFLGAFLLSTPDYYGMLPYTVLCFCTLVFLSGNRFKSWSNVVCFILLFVAPMGAFFGMDPVWGNDFSPFTFKSKVGAPFLVAIWMVSFFYYKYRDDFVSGLKKLVRLR